MDAGTKRNQNNRKTTEKQPKINRKTAYFLARSWPMFRGIFDLTMAGVMGAQRCTRLLTMRNTCDLRLIFY